jgi:hypothetical protein
MGGGNADGCDIEILIEILPFSAMRSPGLVQRTNLEVPHRSLLKKNVLRQARRRSLDH